MTGFEPRPPSSTATAAGSNGLSTTVETNADGVGAIDRRVVMSKQTAADGDVTEIQEIKSENGSLVSKQTVVTQSDGKNSTTTLARGTASNIVLERVTAVQPDGSVYNTTTETHNGVTSKMVEVSSRTTVDGLLTVQSIDDNNDGTIDSSRAALKAILTDGSVRTTLSEYNGSTQLLSTEETTTTGNGQKSTTIWKDGTGGQIRWYEKENTIAQNGSSTVVETYRGGNNSLESQTTQTRSADGNTKVSIRDTDGDGIRNDYISETIGNDGIRTVTSQKLVPAGTVGAAIKTETTSANGLVVTTQFDQNADGASEVKLTSVTTVLDDGTTHTASTRERLLSNGIWQSSREWKTVSGNGLVKTAQWEDAGAGYNLSRNETTVLQADGSRKTTDVVKNGATINRQTETTVSANGLRIDTRRDTDGVGGYDQTALSLTTLLADGRTHETEEFRSGSSLLLSKGTKLSADGTVSVVDESSYVTGWTARTITTDNRTRADGSKVVTALVTKLGTTQKLEQTVVTTSADGRVTTTQHDFNGDNINDQTRVQTLHADGRSWLVEQNQAGNQLLSQVATSTTANGLRTVTETDWNGDTVNDLRKTVTREIFGDGSSSTSTALVNLRTNATKSLTQETVSANGRVKLETTDIDGDGLSDQSVVEERFISGINKITIANNETARASSEIRPGELYWKDTIPYRVEITTSLDGLTRSIGFDNNNDGYFELQALALTQLDGSVTTNLKEYDGATVVATGTMTQSHDQRITILSADTQNDGVIDQVSSTTVSLDGSIKKVQTKLNTAGAVIENTVTLIDATGHMKSSETREGADHLMAKFVREADLSATRTRYDVSTGFITSIEKLTDDEQLKSATFYANGLMTGTALYDVEKNKTWTRFDQFYDIAGRYTGYQTANDDGTLTVGWLDAANTQTWKQYAEIHATNGAVYYTHKLFDDLSYEITSINIYNVANLAWNVDRFNASGVFLDRRQLFDSDAYQVTNFATNGAMSTQQLWGASGNDYTYVEGDPWNATQYAKIEYHYVNQVLSYTSFYLDNGNILTNYGSGTGNGLTTDKQSFVPSAAELNGDSAVDQQLLSGFAEGPTFNWNHDAPAWVNAGDGLLSDVAGNGTAGSVLETGLQADNDNVENESPDVFKSPDAVLEEFSLWQTNMEAGFDPAYQSVDWSMAGNRLAIAMVPESSSESLFAETSALTGQSQSMITAGELKLTSPDQASNFA